MSRYFLDNRIIESLLIFSVFRAGMAEKEYLLRVDKNDVVIGRAGREECHAGKGLLHRGLAAVLFAYPGFVLLARRSGGDGNKRLWRGYLDGTVASHTHSEDETYEAAARVAVERELGAECDRLELLTKFCYAARFGREGSEREVCGLLVGKMTNGNIRVNPKYVDGEVSLVSFNELFRDVRGGNNMSSEYTPWFKKAVKILGGRERGRLERTLTRWGFQL